MPARGNIPNRLRKLPAVDQIPQMPNLPIDLVVPQQESTQPTETSRSQPPLPYRAPVGMATRTNHAEAPAPTRYRLAPISRLARSGTPNRVRHPRSILSPGVESCHAQPCHPQAHPRTCKYLQTAANLFRATCYAPSPFTLASHLGNPVHPAPSQSRGAKSL